MSPRRTTTDPVRALLRDAMDVTERPLDVGALAAAATARARRRRTRVVVGGVAMLAAALLVAVVAITTVDSDGTRVEAPASASAINPDAGVSLTLPDSWQQLPVVQARGPRQVLMVGNAPRPGAAEPIRACDSGAPLLVGTAYLAIYEYDGPPYVLPGGDGTYQEAAFGPRADFFDPTRPPSQRGDCTLDVPGGGPSVGAPGDVHANHFVELPFTEHGRRFVARLVSAGDTSYTLFNEGIGILNTLQVTAGHDQPGDNGAPTTLAGGLATDDPAVVAIAEAFQSAFGDGPVERDAAVEGGFPLSESTQIAAREANPALAGHIIVRMNVVVVDDPTHARVNFDLLVDGAKVTANTDGAALKIDGQWKVAVATFCEVVRRGAVACPG